MTRLWPRPNAPASCYAAGDVEGCTVWKRILAGVGELSSTKPARGEQVALRGILEAKLYGDF